MNAKALYYHVNYILLLKCSYLTTNLRMFLASSTSFS